MDRRRASGCSSQPKVGAYLRRGLVALLATMRPMATLRQQSFMKRLPAMILLVATTLVSQCSVASAANMVLIAPGGARAAVTELLRSFEQATGHHVDATFLSGGATRQRALQGQDFDVAIEEPPYQPIVASGHVVADSFTRLAAVPVALAVHAGVPMPDISTPAAVRKLLLAARSIVYPDPTRGAAAGVSFERTLKQLGIAAQVYNKLRRAQGGGDAMQLVADGKAQIGLTFQSEMQNAGIRVVGPLPNSISPPTALSGFVSTGTRDIEAARNLLRYLASPAAARVYRAHGMQPMH